MPFKDSVPIFPAKLFRRLFILFKVESTSKSEYVLGGIPIFRNADEAVVFEVDWRDVDASKEARCLVASSGFVKKWGGS